MTDQDKRAVEGLARCGISLQGLYDAFPRFPKDEVQEIYWRIHGDLEFWMVNKMMTNKAYL